MTGRFEERRPASIYLRGTDYRIGRLAPVDDRWVAHARDGEFLGRWSTRRRALHAIDQDMLLDLYGVHERAANDR